MLTRILSILSCLVIICYSVSGQPEEPEEKEPKKKKEKPKAEVGPPSSLDVYSSQKKYRPERARTVKPKGITYDAAAKYERQLGEIAKQKRRAERELMKPQNTNPLYFGHKRPPKKRKPGKMKYCKVCGIRH